MQSEPLELLGLSACHCFGHRLSGGGSQRGKGVAKVSGWVSLEQKLHARCELCVCPDQGSASLASRCFGFGIGRVRRAVKPRPTLAAVGHIVTQHSCIQKGHSQILPVARDADPKNDWRAEACATHANLCSKGLRDALEFGSLVLPCLRGQAYGTRGSELLGCGQKKLENKIDAVGSPARYLRPEIRMRVVFQVLHKARAKAGKAELCNTNSEIMLFPSQALIACWKAVLKAASTPLAAWKHFEHV